MALLQKACEALSLYEKFEAELLNDDKQNFIDNLTDDQYDIMMKAQTIRNEVLMEYRRLIEIHK